MEELCFVNTQQPAQDNDVRNMKVIRQHIRKAVLKRRGCSNIDERIKHFTGSKDGLRKLTNPRSTEKNGSDQQCSLVTATSTTSTDNARLTHITLHHPYTTYAASFVQLPAERIDFLFKSNSFRHAAEPLFNTSHVDSAFQMEAVFPGCLTAPAFLNALLFSVVKTANRGKCTVEGLRLQGMALQSLKQTVSSVENSLSYSDIGAMMILQGVAYRWDDFEGHKAHTQGLSRIMSRSGVQESCLTLLGARAMFWQDLFAALLINSERRESHLTLPNVQWQREVRPFIFSTLPIGFVGHQDVLRDTLLSCIEDIVELQSVVSKLSDPLAKRLRISNMQAFIESRLASDGQNSQNLGPVADCCRIALLIACFLSFTDTWANALIPCKLSGMLRIRLEDSLEDLVWSKRRNLQLWLSMIGSYVTILDEGHVENLPQKWHCILTQFCDYCSELPQDALQGICVDSVLNDFLYCGGLLEQRWSVPGWSQLELLLRSR